jgi:hypothetical protein
MPRMKAQIAGQSSVVASLISMDPAWWPSDRPASGFGWCLDAGPSADKVPPFVAGRWRTTLRTVFETVFETVFDRREVTRTC